MGTDSDAATDLFTTEYTPINPKLKQNAIWTEVAGRHPYPTQNTHILRETTTTQ